MATILIDGRRRCDASCYDAKHSECHCICEGKNHRVGVAKAIDNAAADPRRERIVLVLIQRAADTPPTIFGAFNDEASAEDAAKMLRSWGAHAAWAEPYTARADDEAGAEYATNDEAAQ